MGEETAVAEPPIEDAEIVEEPTPEYAELEQAVQRERSQEVVVREVVTVEPATMPTVREWEAMRAMATEICKTNFVPSTFRGKPEECLAAILSGRELGIGPMQSLKDIAIIDGRPALAAHLMLALLRKGGVEILESGSTAERAWIRARRGSGEVCEVEWTIQEAQRANLAAKNNWKHYPADMLWARAVGRLGRRLGSDLLAGMPYSAEEVKDFRDDDLNDTSYSTEPMERPAPVRQERGAEPKIKSWAEIQRAYEKVDNKTEAWALAQAFFTAGCFHMFGQLSTKTMDKAQKDAMFQKAAGVVIWLWENVEPDGPFLYWLEQHQRAAWTHVGCPDLQIPDYVPPEPEGAAEAMEAAAEEAAAE